jgi:hypothetical protein
MAHNYLQRVALAGSQSSTAARPPAGGPPALPAHHWLPPAGTIAPEAAATLLAGPPVAPRPGMTTAPVTSPSNGSRPDMPGGHGQVEAPGREGAPARAPDKSDVDARTPPQVRAEQRAAKMLPPNEAVPAPTVMSTVPLARERTIIQAPASWRAAAKGARPAVSPAEPAAHSHSDTAELAAHAPGAPVGRGAVGSAAPNIVVGASEEARPLRPARSNPMLGYSDPTVVPPLAPSAASASAETAAIAPASPAGPAMPPNPVATAWRQPRITIGRIEVEVRNEAPPPGEATPPKSPAPTAGLSLFESRYLTRFALRPS